MTARNRPGTSPRSPSILAAMASIVVAAALMLGGLSTSAAAPSPATVLGLRTIVGGLSEPVFVTNAGDSRLFVVERSGRIRIVRKVDGVWRVTGTFLDLSSLVGTTYDEQGLLGLAFHPGYAANGRFYVDYTDLGGNVVVAEYRRSSAGKADPTSARQLLNVHIPDPDHNGGWLGFKGNDLYIAVGDGAVAGDPGNRAQDLGTLRGKMLRIDPLDPDGNGPRRYRIPADNPFVGRAGRDEIWAYGLRNPWRDSFDRGTGDLWIGDVGQDRYEEIDHAGSGRGRNFGWPQLEGRHSYPAGAPCTSNCHTLPIVEYPHTMSVADNCAVIGGYVSRRPGAALAGRYVFGDHCSGRIWSISNDFHGGGLPAALVTGLQISSFGEGHQGSIYVCSLSGVLYRVIGT